MDRTDLQRLPACSTPTTTPSGFAARLASGKDPLAAALRGRRVISPATALRRALQRHRRALCVSMHAMNGPSFFEAGRARPLLGFKSVALAFGGPALDRRRDNGSEERLPTPGQHFAQIQSQRPNLLQQAPLPGAQPRRAVLQQDQALQAHRHAL